MMKSSKESSTEDSEEDDPDLGRDTVDGEDEDTSTDTTDTSNEPSAGQVDGRDVCGSTAFWEFADGDKIVPCTSDGACDGFKTRSGEPCCLYPRCICGTTAVTGNDRCGRF